MSRSFAKTAAAVAAAILLSAAAHAQGAPMQITQTMDPPGTADLKPQAEAKKPAKPPARPKAAHAAPVDAEKAASAAGAKLAPKAAAAKPAANVKVAAKPKDDVVHKPMPPVKRVRGKKGANIAPTPAPIDAIEPPPSAHLTGEAAWAKLVGNSINGIYNGSVLVDAYLPDNTVKTKTNGETMIGRWGMVDGRACFQYAPEPQATCYQVALDGDQVTYTDESGEALHFTLSKGIPAGM